MLIGDFKNQDIIQKKDVLDEIKKSERLACLKSFSKLFKGDRLLSKEGGSTIDVYDLFRGIKSLSNDELKDFNFSNLMDELERYQVEYSPEGISEEDFADIMTECLISEHEHGNFDPLQMVFDEFKDPRTDKIDFKILKKLSEYCAKECNCLEECQCTEKFKNNAKDLRNTKVSKKSIFTEEQIQTIIRETAMDGKQINFTDFKKLFSNERF